MQLNYFLTAALAALIPLILGSIWYSKAVFGKAWIASTRLSEEELKKGFNMPLVFFLVYVFSFMVAFLLGGMTMHQMGVYSMMATEGTDPAKNPDFISMMEKYGANFRTFKHGALHGTLAGLFFALPVIGVNAMFERRGFKYIAINTGFWVVALALMGGVICQFTDLQSLGN